MSTLSTLQLASSTVGLAWRDLRGSGRYLWIFWACLMLGVTLIAASNGILRQVNAGMLADTRALFGGDVEIESRQPLGDVELKWAQSRGRVSLLIELRTMILAGEQTELVELQSVDEHYPLYGDVLLEPDIPVIEAVRLNEGVWGVALDPVLADRLAVSVGSTVSIGDHLVEVRAVIRNQPDRALSADWRGPPVLIATEALDGSGLVMPGSRLEYDYRIKVDDDPDAWAEAFARAFPQEEFEVRTVTDRRGRIVDVLSKVTSALLLVGFSALFVGGLGVFNSVRAYLDSKLETIATLRALGLRDGRLAALYLTQIALLAGTAALAGACIGGALAYIGAHATGERLPTASSIRSLLLPLGSAWLFGVLTAICFALPAIGRALSVKPAVLFRGSLSADVQTPARWWRRTALLGVITTVLALISLPQPLFGVVFAAVSVVIILLLEALVRGVRRAARSSTTYTFLDKHFPLKLAVSNLSRRDGTLRVTLLSLGSALTLLVACAVVLAALLETITDTIPEQAPALALYDVSSMQVDSLKSIVENARSLERLDLAPLVLGRLSHVNTDHLRASDDRTRSLESRDEHKLTHRLGNIDEVSVTHGEWWPASYSGPPLVAFEDREAEQLGLVVGDKLQFSIMGETLDAKLSAIYEQRGIGTRFWFEGIFSDGALDAFITRYVGTAYLAHEEAIEVETNIARAMPNIVSVRTARILREARAMLRKAMLGIAVVAGVTLLASLLVLASVATTNRTRQMYDATVLHTLGARLSDISKSVLLEYGLIVLLTALFAIGGGTTIAAVLLKWRLDLAVNSAWAWGALIALGAGVLCVAMSARIFLPALRAKPAMLLRANG